jgi:hypothetical protein
MNDYTSVYRRCGCTDSATGRRYGDNCPRLATDLGHGSWYFSVRLGGQRVRRGGFRTAQDAEQARQDLVGQAPEPASDAGLTVGVWLDTWVAMPPKMLAAAQKWLAARKLTDAPATADKLELAVRVVGDWLGDNQPDITTFADVTRDHVLAWIQHITKTPTVRTGKPLGAISRIQRISGLSQFFRDTAAWPVRQRPRLHPDRARRRAQEHPAGAPLHPRP